MVDLVLSMNIIIDVTDDRESVYSVSVRDRQTDRESLGK